MQKKFALVIWLLSVAAVMGYGIVNLTCGVDVSSDYYLGQQDYLGQQEFSEYIHSRLIGRSINIEYDEFKKYCIFYDPNAVCSIVGEGKTQKTKCSFVITNYVTFICNDCQPKIDESFYINDDFKANDYVLSDEYPRRLEMLSEPGINLCE